MFVSSEYAYFRKTHCVLCRNFYYSRGNTQYRKWRFTRMNFHDYLVGKQVQWSCKMVKCMFYCYRIEEMWLWSKIVFFFLLFASFSAAKYFFFLPSGQNLVADIICKAFSMIIVIHFELDEDGFRFAIIISKIHFWLKLIWVGVNIHF